MFEILGWHIKYQTYLDGREPDYALFSTDGDLHGALLAGRTNAEFWHRAAMVADAKAWHISLDRPTRISGRREYPPEQIEWYLNHSLCEYGILTNGRLWRLVPRTLGPAKPRFQTYLELDLPALLDSMTPAEGELGYPRKTEIARTIEAAKACGIEVTSIEVFPDGGIKVLGPGSAPSALSEFDKWDKAGRL